MRRAHPMGPHDDDRTIGRILMARRQVLGLLGTATVMAGFLPTALSRRRSIGPSPADAATMPSCIVHPEQTEGPYFVDELLERSDIRSDPSDGSISAGTTLALAFAVSRLDGGVCSPFAGAVVDVWHCDAAGTYSDVAANGTAGRKFLRGHQVTGDDGTATFVTIYPGWYPGRTVHIHFKIRTDATSSDALEFTSQLYFDDDLTDVVFAAQPYAARGARSTRNGDDGIYGDGGSELLLAVSDDGAGGYVATFDIGIEMNGTTTTTIVGGGSCADVGTCLANVRAVLPATTGASSRKAKHAAQKLQRRIAAATRLLRRAAASGGAAQARQYGKARAALQHLLAVARAAQARAALDASLDAIEATVAALLALLP